MSNHVITFNAGSSSIKFALFDGAAAAGPRLVASGQVDGLGVDAHFKARTAEGRVLHDAELPGAELCGHADALQAIIGLLGDAFPGAEIAAVGHRVVHGGTRFVAPTAVSDEVLAALKGMVSLAPLHLPHNIAGIEAARRAFPGVKQVACFDTAFHSGHDFQQAAYALPRRFYDEGIRSYGFHGLSYEYIARRLAELAPGLAAGRVVVAHLGNGASMCAMHAGRSIESTMGFTPLDGLPMGTRCGAIDPGLLLHLLEARGYDAQRLSELLYKQSGLLGLSGVSSDMRELEASSRAEAGEAIDYFCARIRRETGALAAVLGGLDALVFTGGIGEHSARVRREVIAGLGWLGVEQETADDDHGPGDRCISSAAARVQAWVIATDEEGMIARHVLAHDA